MAAEQESRRRFVSPSRRREESLAGTASKSWSTYRSWTTIQYGCGRIESNRITRPVTALRIFRLAQTMNDNDSGCCNVLSKKNMAKKDNSDVATGVLRKRRSSTFGFSYVFSLATLIAIAAAVAVGNTNTCYGFSTTSKMIPVVPHWTTEGWSVQRRRQRQFSHQLAAVGSSKIDSLGNVVAVGGEQRPYVPSGLTREEYDRIKEEEELRRQNMEYGAWGPRFRRSDRPDGDWMVLPQLWTVGFGTGGPSSSSPGASTSEINRIGIVRTRWRQMARVVGTRGPSFLLALIGIECFLAAVTGAVGIIPTLPQLQQQVIRRQQEVLAVVRVAFGLLGRLALASGLAGPTCRYLEWTGRRRLWTPRRTWIATAAALVAGSALARTAVWCVVAAVRHFCD